VAKKILGILFFVGALLILVGSIANGSLFSDQGSAAATYGNFLGTIIPIIIYVLCGIFLLTFDNPTKLNYIDGFKKRSKQSSKFIPLMIAYGVLMLFSAMGVGASDTDNYILSYLIAIVPYVIPLCIFVSFYQIYALTHNASKKYFVNSDSALNEYLSTNETFYAWSDDNFVLASNKVLYFPQLFCVIPFNQISSIKFYKELWEQGTYINLTNGKKIYIATKHFDRIQEAVNAANQVC
jgi:uncharacterized membrane protein HdeD (DUF308 family)